MTADGPETASMIEALLATPAVEKRQLLEEKGQLLLRPEAESALRAAAARAKSDGDQAAALFFLTHAELLAACREQGVTAVFERLQWAADRSGTPLPALVVLMLVELQVLARDLQSEHDQGKLRRQVALCEQVLARISGARHPELWGELQSTYADALLRLGDLSGDAAVLQQAVAGYDAALAMYTRERGPVYWASVQNRRAGALLRLGDLSGDAAVLQRAVAGFDAVLEVYTRERDPEYWAAAQNSLAGALLRLYDQSGDAALLQQAVARYEAALAEYTRERSPAQWAAAQNSLARALLRLGTLASGEPPPSEEAYVNLSFEDEDDHQKLDVGTGLTAGHVYRLQVGLGPVIDPLQKGTPAPPMRKEAGDTVSLRVAVLPRTPGIRFTNHIAYLTWGPGPHVDPAEFVVHALAPGPAFFDVYIDRDCDLLFVAAVEAIVAQPGTTEWPRADPIGWLDVTSAPARRRSRAFRRFTRLEQASSVVRSICIAVQRATASDEYLLTVLSAGTDIELPMRARFSTLELDTLIKTPRGAFERLRRDGVMLDGGYDERGRYHGRYEPADECHRVDGSLVPRELILDCVQRGFIRDMAISGAAIRARLFADESAQDIHSFIRSSATDGSVVQIWTDESATDFLLPWNWLYDEPFDPQYRTPPRLECFWGLRLIIEQICDCLEPPLRLREDPRLPTERGLLICAGVFNFAQLPAHREFLQSLATEKNATPRIEVRVWNHDRQWEEFLPRCDADILYFFSHGHTAKPAGAASAAVNDMAEALRNWLHATGAPDETQETARARKRFASVLAELAAGGLADQHHIRLEVGNLMLEDLRKLNALNGHTPLIILNMCESAQVFPSLGDGFVRTFLARGAVGVLGTEMPMLPQFADLFGRQLLTRTLAG